MLQQQEPEDFVIATGKQHSVKDVIETSARQLGISIHWEGKGVEEKGINEENNKTIVAVDAGYFRPTEVDNLLGDASKAKEKLGWEPRISFEQLISEMVTEDMKEAQKDNLCRQEGYKTYDHFE